MRKIVSLIALMLGGCAAVADAGPLVDVQIVNRSTGQVMESYRHHGRTYVAGNPGDRYAVSIANRSGGRLLTVLSVDGVNAVTGETAAARQSGYVLGPWSSADIRGWRKSMDDVAAFYFTALPDSYAARTGRPDEVGVIGVAVYREQPEPRAELEQRKSRAPQAAGAAPEAAAPAERWDRAKEERLGTGHGERMNDPTRYTEFRRASEFPAQVVTVYYDSRANLAARGIIPPTARNHLPRPFPAGFVADPRD